VTQVPAGWYPDPASSPDGFGQRYWDGRQWTDHVHPGLHSAGWSGGAYGDPAAATTPDGQALAGWWHRVGAYLVDGVIVTAVTLAAGFPLLLQVGRRYADYFDQVAHAGTAPVLGGSAQLAGDIAGPMALLSLIGLVVSFVYNVGFLKGKQATPGKLLVGLRVRRRAVAGPLPWSTVLVRWVTQNWYSFLFLVPVLGAVVRVFPLLDDLWPLWDARRQALHDKAAGTNVVRR